MKMYGSICGVAAALSLVAFTAATPAAARGGDGWKADYVGNEWINDNIAKSRSATESDEDSRPTRKAQRTSRAAPADSDTPAPRASRRCAAFARAS